MKIESEPKRILLVEDEFLIAIQKQRQLQNYNYQVEHVSSGEEAIDFALNEETAIDLILMDINLGQMMGTEAAQIILSQKEIPIVFFSSHSEPEIVRQTENITSYGYILKDSSIVVLDASIKMALKLFEANKKLKRSESFRKKIFENSRIPFVILETEHFTCIDCNEAALKLHAFENKSDLIGKTLLDFSAEHQYDGSPSDEKIHRIYDLAIADGSIFFEWRCEKSDGKAWDTEIQMLSFKSEGNILLQYSIFDVTEKRLNAIKIQEKETRIKKQRIAIAKMVSDTEVFGSDPVVAFNKINEYITSTLSVERSGIWLLSEDNSELAALSIFDSKSNSFGRDIVLNTADFPNYLSAILAENRIYCEDAINDPRTSDLRGYLEAFNISSLLDAGFFMDGNIKGVICSEHVGEKRKWHADEESFISTVAAVVGQIFSKHYANLQAVRA